MRIRLDKYESILDNNYMLIKGRPSSLQHISSILLWWYWRGIKCHAFFLSAIPARNAG